jgi:hypothetical protein
VWWAIASSIRMDTTFDRLQQAQEARHTRGGPKHRATETSVLVPRAATAWQSGARCRNINVGPGGIVAGCPKRDIQWGLVVAHKQTTSREILLWMTPSEAPKALQASECSELLDPTRANCWISAQHQPGKFAHGVNGSRHQVLNMATLVPLLVCIPAARDWAEAHIKIARMTLTIKLDRNWSSFQLANSAPPLSVTDSAIAPSARIQAPQGFHAPNPENFYIGASLASSCPSEAVLAKVPAPTHQDVHTARANWESSYESTKILTATVWVVNVNTKLRGSL